MNIREALDLVSQRNKAEDAQTDDATNKPLQFTVDNNNVIIQNLLEVIGRGIKSMFWDMDEEVAEYIDDIEFGEFILWYCTTKYACKGDDYDFFTGIYLYDKLGLAQRNTDSQVMRSMLRRIQAEFPRVIRTTSTQGVVEEDLIEPVPVDASRSDDRYQEKPKKRTRYQNGNDSRWQNPPEDRKTTPAKKPNSPA